MSKKLIFAGIVTLVLLALVASPALAVPPEHLPHLEVVWGPDFLVDCSEYGEDYSFVIEWTTEATLDGELLYNRDGTFKKLLEHVSGERIFENMETHKQVSGSFSFIEVWTEGDTWGEAIHHGLEIRLALPGYGVVFLQAGTIDYYLTWNGEVIEDIVFTAGPKDWTDEEYGMLCAALAD